ncbi:MAG: DUF721 domain-containing protein [Patescibacteria group bacterium]
MKKIGLLISQKDKVSNSKLENKDFFYLFERIIKAEYGNQGAKNLKANFFKNGKIFVKSESSAWANELLLNKNEIIKKINQEIGNKEIQDIKIN